MLTPLRNKLVEVFPIRRSSFGHRLYKVVVTFDLVSVAWVFFRASGVRAALHMLKSMFMVRDPRVLFDGPLYQLGLEQR